MQKKITCIECPQGCQLEIDVEGGRVIRVAGNKCEKGIAYAGREIESPKRILTTTVPAKGLEIKRVPVRTNRPIARGKISLAMQQTQKIILTRPVRAGETIIEKIAGEDADLVASRGAGAI